MSIDSNDVTNSYLITCVVVCDVVFASKVISLGAGCD